MPHLAEEFAKMLAFFEHVPSTEWIEPGRKVLTREALGVTGLQSLWWERAKGYELPSL